MWLAKYCGTSVEMIERHSGRYMDSDEGQLALLVDDAKERVQAAASGGPGGHGGGARARPPTARAEADSGARTGTFAGTFRDARLTPRVTKAEGGRFEPRRPKIVARQKARNSAYLSNLPQFPPRRHNP